MFKDSDFFLTTPTMSGQQQQKIHTFKCEYGVFKYKSYS